MPDEKPHEPIKKIKYKRAEDFVSAYSNNIFYETSVFDIKLTFGELFQPPEEEPFIEQHTSIAMSWLEAKVAALFFAVNVASHEKKFGIMPIPDGILPPFFQKSAEEGKLSLTKLLDLIEERPVPQPESPTTETPQ